jgi:hypothetical protein
LILLLHLRGAFGRQHPDLATLQPKGFETEADRCRPACDASQGCEHRARFVDRLRRMRPSLRFHGVPRPTPQALWAMDVEWFQRFHTACVIQFERGSPGMGRDGTQRCDRVRWSTLTLEPQGFHPLLHTRMRMMVALRVQRLFVCLTACKSEHPMGHPFGEIDRCGAPS